MGEGALQRELAISWKGIKLDIKCFLTAAEQKGMFIYHTLSRDNVKD